MSLKCHNFFEDDSNEIFDRNIPDNINNIFLLFDKYDKNIELIRTIIEIISNNKNDLSELDKIPDVELKNILLKCFPNDHYNYGSDCLNKYVKTEYIKNIFGEIYLLYEKIHIKLYTIKNLISNNKECDNKTELIKIIDEIIELINNLQKILQNKNLIYCAGYKKLLDFFNKLKTSLEKCGPEYSREHDIYFSLLERDIGVGSEITDKPISICIGMMMVVAQLKNPRKKIEKIEKIENLETQNITQNNNKNKNYVSIIVPIVIVIIIIIASILFYRKYKLKKSNLNNTTNTTNTTSVNTTSS
jgi:hypothetical protein